jgi:ATP-dependent DNA helicase RecQ
LLPGFISSLRSANLHEENRPIRVVLASATLTSHSVTSLEKLFSGQDGISVVSGVFLRPEIRYAIKKSQIFDRDNFVIEAVLKAPRPFILYVTRPEEADYWMSVLKKKGIGRIACFTGETLPLQRKNLLHAWEENQLDGMIATSAFGLGVDKSDVRTVIHATLPESLDRFYQEVGRSGRDGKASASILIFNDDDVSQARDMSNPKLIGNELGYERWISMLDDPMRPITDDGKQWLNLNRLRAGLSVQGKKNLAWNLRTLNLMATAGLIEIDDLSAVITNQTIENSDIDYSDSQIKFASVRVLHPEHRDPDFYEQRMNSARIAMQDASSKAFELMHKVAKLELEVSDALVNLYGLSLSGYWSDVESNCAGCKFHWNEHRLPLRKLIPFVSRIDKFTSRVNNWPDLFELPKEQKI